MIVVDDRKGFKRPSVPSASLAPTIAGVRDEYNLRKKTAHEGISQIRLPSVIMCRPPAYSVVVGIRRSGLLRSVLLATQPPHREPFFIMSDLFRTALQARFAKAPQLPPLPGEEEEEETGDDLGSLPTGMGPPAA